MLLCVSLQRATRAAAEESDAVFTELIRSIELKRFEVRELIKAQEKMAVSQAEQLLEKVQKEIAELKKSEAELDKLSHTEDHIHFLQVITCSDWHHTGWVFRTATHLKPVFLCSSLQSCQSLHAPPDLSALPSVTADPNLTFGPVMTAVADFKGLLQEVCQGGFVSIYERGNYKGFVRLVFLFHPHLFMWFPFSLFCSERCCNCRSSKRCCTARLVTAQWWRISCTNGSNIRWVHKHAHARR